MSRTCNGFELAIRFEKLRLNLKEFKFLFCPVCPADVAATRAEEGKGLGQNAISVSVEPLASIATRPGIQIKANHQQKAHLRKLTPRGAGISVGSAVRDEEVLFHRV